MPVFNFTTVNILCRKCILKSTLRTQLPNVFCAASITSKEFREPVKKPAPFPYQTKVFNYFHWFFDSTLKRFDDNTKVIVVDGNIGAGKTALAKHLADAFEMLYVPEPDMKDIYITPYGYDLRLLDDIMPPTYKSCTIETFYNNPFNQNVARFQFRMLMLRYMSYLDAITHVLNTGQGVVLDRSVYSDIVFAESMYRAGYFRKEVRDYYIEIYQNIIEDLLPPHLFVYLDVPIETIMKRIKQRNRPAEVNTKVLNAEYLGNIESMYKDHFLAELSRESEVIMYDWTDYGEMEVVVEDIERMDFDKYTIYEDKLKPWRVPGDDWEWANVRMEYTSRKNYLYYLAYIDRPRVTEVYHPAEDNKEFQRILEQIPGQKYYKGFNWSMGDSFNLFGKVTSNSLRTSKSFYF